MSCFELSPVICLKCISLLKPRSTKHSCLSTKLSLFLQAAFSHPPLHVPCCPPYLQHCQSVSLHHGIWSQASLHDSSGAAYIYVSTPETGFHASYMSPQNPLHWQPETCVPKETIVSLRTKSRFLSLLHVCCTQCWACCSVLVSGLSRSCEKWRGRDQCIASSTCQRRKGMRTFSTLLMFCTVDQHREAFLGSLIKVKCRNNSKELEPSLLSFCCLQPRVLSNTVVFQ